MVGGPVLCIAWPGCDNTEKIPEHVCTVYGTISPRISVLPHDEVFANTMNEVFPDFCEVISGQVVISHHVHGFLL